MSSIESLGQFVAGIALVGACAAFLAAARHDRRTGHTSRLIAGLAPLGLMIALTALTASLISRGVDAARWPVGARHEFTVLSAIALLAAHAVLWRRARQPYLGVVIGIVALALLLAARLTQPAAGAIQALPAVVQGLWFPLHTALLALACGSLGLAASSAALQLVAPRVQVSGAVDWSMNLGYVALSLGMIAGAIWGELAWGEYWTWSTKEIWTLATWLTCTLFLHVRHRRGWRGRPALQVTILAFAMILTTVYLTPWLVRWTRLISPPLY
jgi:ABC-type transport system involved in cytochrome c biogenesis permease subunit